MLLYGFAWYWFFCCTPNRVSDLYFEASVVSLVPDRLPYQVVHQHNQRRVKPLIVYQNRYVSFHILLCLRQYGQFV